MREAARARSADIAPGWDIVLLAREASRDVSFAQVVRAFDQLLAQAGLCSNRNIQGSAT